MVHQVNRQVGDRPDVDDRRRGRARPPVRAANAAARRQWRYHHPLPAVVVAVEPSSPPPAVDRRRRPVAAPPRRHTQKNGAPVLTLSVWEMATVAGNATPARTASTVQLRWLPGGPPTPAVGKQGCSADRKSGWSTARWRPSRVSRSNPTGHHRR